MATERHTPLSPPFVCRWAAGLFLAPPDAEALADYGKPEGLALLAGLRADPALAPVADTLADLVAPGADLADGADRLATAHSAAFLVGGRRSPAPYASVWLSPRGLLYQEPARQMKRLLAEAGLDLEQGFSEPPDHLGVQLNFLAELLERAASGAAVPIAPGDFAADHVMSWLPRFAAACDDLRNPFLYPALAHGVADFLAREIAP